MSDPFTTLQTETRDRLAGDAYLASIPIVVESIGSLETAIETALAGGGVKDGATGKVGLCLILITPTGLAADNFVTQKQDTTLRVNLIAVPELNSNEELGQQKPPLTVLYAVIKRLLTWARGQGQTPVRFKSWDSSATEKEIIYSADFTFRQVLALT